MAVSLHCSTKESNVKINKVNISKLYIKDVALQTRYLIQKVHCGVYKETGYKFGKPQRTQGTPLGGKRVLAAFASFTGLWIQHTVNSISPDFGAFCTMLWPSTM